MGRGELNPTDDKEGRDNIKYKDESIYKESRSVFISFYFDGHDADTLVYNTIAPSKNIKKPLTFDITEFQTDKCFRIGDKHEKKIKLKDIGQTIEKTFTTPSFVYEVCSNLSRFNAFPIQYIWPSATTPNKVYLYLNSCRYYSNKKKAVLLVNVYPDIKWELALEFLVNVSNYKEANMPAGRVFAAHQEKSREEGYKRWLINESGKTPISVGVGLSAEWNNEETKRSFTNEFEDRIKIVAEVISSFINILQDAINYAQGVAKTTAIPVGFDIRYPKFAVVGKWYLERGDKSTIKTVGEVSLGFKPLIGAEVVIDIIGATIAAVSYGLTGNPAAARIINKFRGKLSKLGASITFTATFYGELEFEIDALKIDSINGIKMQGKSTIGGKMGVNISLEIKIGGKMNNKNVKSKNYLSLSVK